MTKFLGYLAIDQYGQHYNIGDEPPRKWLLQHFGRKHADKMYVDLKGGGNRHKGYVIAGHWLSIYKVFSWNK